MSLGDGTDFYTSLAQAAEIEVIGFEPIPAEYEKLRRNAPAGRTYLPYAVGDGGEHPFHECNFPMTSSIFPPNRELVDKFQALGELMQVVERSQMKTVRLDDIPECAGADFIKVDTQGAELMILQGATERLRTAQVLEIEVEFVQLYAGQPLFADVDAFLRAQGFQLHKLNGLSGRAFKPIIWRGDPSSSMSQLLWSDAIYVKDFMKFDELSVAQLFNIAIIMHETYKSVDLAALALEAADRLGGTDYHAAYLKKFSGG
jgi:FkbM family methyltransferase